MIRHAVLTLALAVPLQVAATHCDSPTDHVQAVCSQPSGFTFTYDGTRAGMPVGCTIIGTGDAGDPGQPVTQADSSPTTVTFDAGGGLTGRADPRDVPGVRSSDDRVLRCTVEDGKTVTYGANSRPTVDVDHDLASGRCTVIAGSAS